MSRLFGLFILSFAMMLGSFSVLDRGSEASSLMSACRLDIGTLCEGVREGRGRISACLYAHDRRLSQPCAAEVSSIANSRTFNRFLPANLDDLQASGRAASLTDVCSQDIRARCEGVGSDTRRILACLYARADEISPPCHATAESIVRGN